MGSACPSWQPRVVDVRDGRRVVEMGRGSQLGSAASDRVDGWVLGKAVVPWNDAIAVTWGRLAGRAHLRGRPRPQNDTWVAACCIEMGVGLLTLNRRDFVDFAEHEGLLLLGGEGR